MKTRCWDVRIGSMYEAADYDENELAEEWGGKYERVYNGSIARLYEALESDCLSMVRWITHFDVEVLDVERSFCSKSLSTLLAKPQQTTFRLHYARLVGMVLHLLPELRKLTIDLYHRNINNNNSDFSPLRYLFGCDEPLMNLHLHEIAAFKNLKEVDWQSEQLPMDIACLPTLDRLHLQYGCAIPDTSTWRTTPNLKFLCIDLSASALLANRTSSLWDPAHDHLFDFIGYCTCLKKLEIELYDIFQPASSHVEHAHAFVKNLAAVASALDSLKIGPSEHSTSCLNHILPVYSALRIFPRLKHLTMPQEILFRSRQLPKDVNDRFASAILPESLESLEILHPHQSIFEFLGFLRREHELYLSFLKNVTISCSKGRGMCFAEKNGKGGMLQLWNRSAVVKDFSKSCICVSVRYTDWDAPESWKDVYERATLALERFAVSLGPEMLPEV